MNRPLKFRVWDNKKKIWLDKTDFCIYNGDAQEVEIGGTEYLYNGSSYNPLKFVENDIGGLYCNRNLIIQQYTGLNDKNGEEIYEGDILQSIITNTFYQVKHGWYRQYEELELENGKIHTFNYAHVGFFVEYNENGEACEGTLAIRNSNSVVVGNIFENSELLK